MEKSRTVATWASLVVQMNLTLGECRGRGWALGGSGEGAEDFLSSVLGGRGAAAALLVMFREEFSQNTDYKRLQDVGRTATFIDLSIDLKVTLLSKVRVSYVRLLRKKILML